MPAGALLAWFERSARSLPWRQEPRDSYHVLVSELMLQQTQVDRVAPRFETFVRRFPTLEALAAASEEEVLAMWSGLGYYRRARLLHRLAQGVVAGPGVLPRDAADLARLPGVGPYTAAAVASLAFGQAVPVLDGNVLRVGSRVMALAEDPRSAGGRRLLEGWVRSLLEVGQPGRVNEALMELGATVCAPRSPRCGDCPLAGGCRALQLGRPEAFPPPRRVRPVEHHRWVAACALEPGGRWLLKRVTEGPILRGLWLPPFQDLEQGDDPVASAVALLPVQHHAAVRQVGRVEHGITHRRITVVPVVVRVAGGALPGSNWRWFDVEEKEVATSSLLRKLVDAVAGAEWNEPPFTLC